HSAALLSTSPSPSYPHRPYTTLFRSVVQNNQLKKDVNQSHAKAEELNEYISVSNKRSMHFEASYPAESFIRGYFDFEDHPIEGRSEEHTSELQSRFDLV